jgi:hypothetical protein
MAIDPRVRELLRAFLAMAKEVKKPYAIGGALAMRAHGYARQTSDVDVFLRDRDRLAWLRAARTQGLTVDRVFSGHHYMAFFVKHRDPRVRIDLLFPAAEPAVTAIRKSEEKTIDRGIVARVFGVELLTIEKFTSDRPEDQRDVEAMFDLGLVEPETVRFLLRSVDPGAVPRWNRFVVARERK